jgi:lipoic acid synthetase
MHGPMSIITMSRLYRDFTLLSGRPQIQTLNSLLEYAKNGSGHIHKVRTMLGLGESLDEVMNALRDLRHAGCDFLTVGQYLRPSRSNLPVVEYIHPQIFEKLRLAALSMGFKYAASGPLVRSSMNAENMYNRVESLPMPQ